MTVAECLVLHSKVNTVMRGEIFAQFNHACTAAKEMLSASIITRADYDSVVAEAGETFKQAVIDSGVPIPMTLVDEAIGYWTAKE